MLLNRKNLLDAKAVISERRMYVSLVLEIHCFCTLCFSLLFMRLCVAAVELFPSWRALDGGTIKARHYFPFQSSEEVLSLSDEGTDGRGG